MDVTPLIKKDLQIIQSYKENRFRISGRLYEGGVIVMPEKSHEWNIRRNVSELKLSDFKILLDRAKEIDVLLMGCGAQMCFLKPEMALALKEGGLKVETMDTGAACRTYNVLMAEGRQVAAALIPV